MYCSKCGALLDDNNICPRCERSTDQEAVLEERIEKERKVNFYLLKPIEKIMFILSIVMIGLTVIPINYYFIGTALVFGICVLVFEIILYKKNCTNITRIGIIISAVSVITNIMWLFFGLVLL